MPFQYKDANCLKQLLMSHFGPQINCFCLKGFDSPLSDATIVTIYIPGLLSILDFVMSLCKSSQTQAWDDFLAAWPRIRCLCTSSTFQHHLELQHSRICFLQEKLGATLACCWGGLVSTASPNPTHPPFVCDSNVLHFMIFLSSWTVVTEAGRPCSWMGYALTGL